MSVNGILQSLNCTPKCLSVLKSCTRLFQHDIGKLLLPREHTFILPAMILLEWQLFLTLYKLNHVCTLAINYHKAQKNVEVSCQVAYPLEQPLTIIVYAAHLLTSVLR
ncbi:hypothetical protein T06_7821 [Trichinella sp. T6]|nr:hypothetical protein T06_7821 [Trichinella sp. T6]